MCRCNMTLVIFATPPDPALDVATMMSGDGYVCAHPSRQTIFSWVVPGIFWLDKDVHRKALPGTIVRDALSTFPDHALLPSLHNPTYDLELGKSSLECSIFWPVVRFDELFV